MHNFNTLPTKHKDLVVSSAYAAGTTMVDFTSPSNPKEVGYLDPHEGSQMLPFSNPQTMMSALP